MAQKVQISLIDDLTGQEADETITFGLDGATYEIDLSTKNADKLRKQLAPFVGGARRTSTTKRGRKNNGAGPRPAEVRSWATANGYEVTARGRIPASVMEAYAAVHGG
jgi:hypothetical protein